VVVIALSLVSLLVGAGAALVGIGSAARRDRLRTRDLSAYLRSLDESPRADEFAERLSEPFAGRVLLPAARRLLRAAGSFTPTGRRDRVARRLVVAGMAQTIRPEDFLAVQMLTTLTAIVLGALYLGLTGRTSTFSLAAALLLVAAGAIGPQAWLNRRVATHKRAVFMDLPDTLDLLAISVEAGVGFEAALAIVCRHFDSPLATEFARTLSEMELGMSRREALHGLKARNEVPELSNFVMALTQADALGMPMSRVLHTQAAELRSRRRQWARERAAKLPVKILLPLIAFIFPPVLLVVLGPAASSIARSFR